MSVADDGADEGGVGTEECELTVFWRVVQAEEVATTAEELLLQIRELGVSEKNP